MHSHWCKPHRGSLAGKLRDPLSLQPQFACFVHTRVLLLQKVRNICKEKANCVPLVQSKHCQSESTLYEINLKRNQLCPHNREVPSTAAAVFSVCFGTTSWLVKVHSTCYRWKDFLSTFASSCIHCWPRPRFSSTKTRRGVLFARLLWMQQKCCERLAHLVAALLASLLALIDYCGTSVGGSPVWDHKYQTCLI